MRRQSFCRVPLRMMLATGFMVDAISDLLYRPNTERFPDVLPHTKWCYLPNAIAHLIATVEHYLVTLRNAHDRRILCRTQGGMNVAETSTSRLLRFLRSAMMFRATMAG